MLVGGEVRVLPQPKHPEYGQYVLSPRETRALFREKGWKRVVAFQTRNPLHRAHEYALVAGLERLTRAGHFAGAVLNPLVGETKGDDVDAATRMRTYQALDRQQGPRRRRQRRRTLEEGRAAILRHLILLGLDIKMFYGGPKEAIMHAIYRQNFGFTDIIIGRKHADAPYRGRQGHLGRPGRPAQVRRTQGRTADQAGEGRLRRVLRGAGPRRSGGGVRAKGYKPVSISGRELREKLAAASCPIRASCVRRRPGDSTSKKMAQASRDHTGPKRKRGLAYASGQCANKTSNWKRLYLSASTFSAGASQGLHHYLIPPTSPSPQTRPATVTAKQS